MKPLPNNQIAEQLIKSAEFETTACFEKWDLIGCDCDFTIGERNYIMQYSLSKPFTVKCELSYCVFNKRINDWVVGVIDDENKGDIEFLFANGVKELYWKLVEDDVNEMRGRERAEKEYQEIEATNATLYPCSH